MDTKEEIVSTPKEIVSKTEEIVSKTEEIVQRPKKMYIKRKSEVLQTLEKKEVTVTEKKDDTATEKKDVTAEVDDDESDEEPPTKRVKITKDDQTTESTPSLWRGVVAKPLLLAAVSAVSFYINSVYNTNQSQTPTGFTTIKKRPILAFKLRILCFRLSCKLRLS